MEILQDVRDTSGFIKARKSNSIFRLAECMYIHQQLKSRINLFACIILIIASLNFVLWPRPKNHC